MIYIIYHSSDLDGHCSGAIARYALEEKGDKLDIDFKMIGLDYGQVFDESIIEDGDTVYFLDFTFQPYERMGELGKRCDVCVIDHHRSAFDYLRENNIRGLYGDDNKAGCYQAWLHFFGTKVPFFIKLLSDYDCWIKHDEEKWEEQILPFQYALRSKETIPENPEAYLFWYYFFKGKYDVSDYYSIGKAIIKYQREEDVFYAKNAFEIEFEGLKVIVLNGRKGSNQFRSLSGLDKYDALMVFSNVENKYWTVSLYNEGQGSTTDLSKIATKYGGGGHPSACGFQIKDITKIIGEIK